MLAILNPGALVAYYSILFADLFNSRRRWQDVIVAGLFVSVRLFDAHANFFPLSASLTYKQTNN